MNSLTIPVQVPIPDVKLAAWWYQIDLRIILQLHMLRQGQPEGGKKGGLAFFLGLSMHCSVFDHSKTGRWEGQGTRLEEAVFPILCGSGDRPTGQKVIDTEVECWTCNAVVA